MGTAMSSTIKDMMVESESSSDSDSYHSTDEAELESAHDTPEDLLALCASNLPEDIRVRGDPPLCRFCTKLLRNRDAQQDMQGSERLRASAGLGCYVCSLLFNAEWYLTDPGEGKKRSSVPPQIKLNDTSIPISIINYRGTGFQEGRIYINFSCLSQEEADLETLTFSLRLLLLKEQGTVKPHRALINAYMNPEVDDMKPCELPATSSSRSVGLQAMLWIEECQSQHKCSRVLTSSWKPTRLIFVGNPDENIQSHLCLSATIPEQKPYMTLSHSWGLANIFRLLSTNVEDVMKELPVSQLSRVFQDAINLTRQLGIEYIWIDSLCIIQDSSEDWATESQLMDRVYQHSWCSIAATGFRDGLKSFYVERDPKIIQPRKLRVKLKSDKPTKTGSKHVRGVYYFVENIWEAYITNAPLNQRAWVLQERLLSPRILHMGCNQVYWECAQLEACETFPNGLPKSLECGYKSGAWALNSEGQFPRDDLDEVCPRDLEKELYDLWYKTVVPFYNVANLTRYEDKLVAISGVAKKMQGLIEDKYVAGLWEKDLLHQLLWIMHKATLESLNVPLKPFPKEYQAPSWSWAAINSPVKWLDIDDGENLAEIIDYKVIPIGNSEYGQIRGGYIRIRGKLTRATFADDVDDDLAGQITETPMKLPEGTFLELGICWDGIASSDNLNPESSRPRYLGGIIGSSSVWVLPVCDNLAGRAWLGLVLVKSGSGKRGEYRRVGWFATPKKAALDTLKSHVPSLEAEEYESVDEGGYTISII